MPASAAISAGVLMAFHLDGDVLVEESGRWRSDQVRDSGELVRWRPAIQVTTAGRWAGPGEDGHWLVGLPGRDVMRADSPGGVISLLPLLERPMTVVAGDLGTGTLAGHGLGFERVLDAALSGRARGYWAAKAIGWLAEGFPAAGYLDSLRRVVADRGVEQRARQNAARILARELPRHRGTGG